MSTSINTNISAIAAQNSLRTTGLKQDSAMERLSTGIRINNAKDDAAGLAISTRMTANIRGISAAIRNANDGISLTQTAEGSLSAIGDNLQRIRELAVQSANSTNTASDRNALHAEASQLVAEIDRVASNTTFNGIKLLDGTYQNQSLQVGAGNDTNDRITVSIGNAKATALGVGSGSSYGLTRDAGTKVKTLSLASGDLSINGVQVASTSIDGVSSSFANASGIAKAAAINSISGQTGVAASVGQTTWTGIAASAATALASGTVFINGFDIGAIEASSNAVDRGTQVTAAINAKSAQTGVVATSDSSGVITLNAADGRNISVKTTAAGASGTGLGGSSAASSLTSDVTIGTTATSGQTVIYGGLTFTAGSANATASQLATAFSNLKYGMTSTEANAVATSAGIAANVGSFTSGTSYISSGTASSAVVTITDHRGTMTAVPDADAGDTASTTFTGGTLERVNTSAITLSTTRADGITLGGAKGLTSTGQAAGYTASVSTLGAGVSSIDLSTSAGSQAALTVLDKAINTVTDSRASMGAYQNRLAASISNLEVSSMNLQASRSRILDTDYAKETTNLAKAQIVQQAATAMLAQANQSSQSVLALLK
jgi:flagellin